MAIALAQFTFGAISLDAGPRLPTFTFGAISLDAGIRLPITQYGELARGNGISLPNFQFGKFDAGTLRVARFKVKVDLTRGTLKVAQFKVKQDKNFGMVTLSRPKTFVNGNRGKLVVKRFKIDATGANTGRAALKVKTLKTLGLSYIGVGGNGRLIPNRFVIRAYGETSARKITLKSEVVRGVGYVGNYGVGKLKSSVTKIDGISNMLYAASAAIVVKRLATRGTSLLGTVGGNATLTANKPRINATGYFGTFASGKLRTSSLRADGFGYITLFGRARLIAKRNIIVSIGSEAASTGLLSFVMNTSNFAVTENDFAFNSFGIVDGVMLGASDAGLFEITGTTDNGADIKASVTFGKYDFGTRKLKRATDAYGYYDADQDITFNVIQAGRAYDYRLPNRTGLSKHKANLGKGLRHEYQQYGFTNTRGGTFRIDKIAVVVDTLST